MTKVICAEDCGNAPKKLLTNKILTALAWGDNAFILKHLSAHITWTPAGVEPVRGRNAVAALLEQAKRETKALMAIENIITHGLTGAANGTMKLKNGKAYAFCHVYRFSGAREASIKELTAHVIGM